jgi:trk system potassium uptake protein TrkA
VVGQRVGDIRFPADTTLMAIVRGPRVITPTSDDLLEAGDEALFLVHPDSEQALEKMLSPQS